MRYNQQQQPPKLAKINSYASAIGNKIEHHTSSLDQQFICLVIIDGLYVCSSAKFIHKNAVTVSHRSPQSVTPQKSRVTLWHTHTHTHKHNILLCCNTCFVGKIAFGYDFRQLLYSKSDLRGDRVWVGSFFGFSIIGLWWQLAHMVCVTDKTQILCGSLKRK